MSSFQIDQKVSSGELTPAISNIGRKFKSFIVFDDNQLLDTGSGSYSAMIANRANALIDIRVGTDGKLHNFGTAGEIIYTDLTE